MNCSYNWSKFSLVGVVELEAAGMEFSEGIGEAAPLTKLCRLGSFWFSIFCELLFYRVPISHSTPL
jgi:hypothetical protein